MKKYLISILVLLFVGTSVFAETTINGIRQAEVKTVSGPLTLTDGTDPHIIKALQETGLGGRLTIGLDETARTMVFCDYGDVDVDFGLSTSANPTLYIFNATGSSYLNLDRKNVTSNSTLNINANATDFYVTGNVSAGNAYDFLSDSNRELTDTDAEQAWMYLEPKINQSATGAYNGVQIVVTETALGDASTGQGGTNNFIVAGTTADEDMFKVDNVGRIVLAETIDPAALADHAFLYAKDVAGTGNLFAADAAAAATQLTSHNFSLFEPEASEDFPWSFYAENKALGKKINVDMAGMVRAVEALTGKKFIHYADMAKEIDIAASQKARWKMEWIKANTTMQEVAKKDAFEEKEVEQDKWYLKIDGGKAIKYRKQIGETTTGYELVGDEVKAIKVPVWEQETVTKQQKKDGVSFSAEDGKFYKRTVPTEAQAENEAKTKFVATVPKWIDDRLKEAATP